jgi:hypothetical protein
LFVWKLPKKINLTVSFKEMKLSELLDGQ